LKGKFGLYPGHFFFDDPAVVYSVSRPVFNRTVGGLTIEVLQAVVDA